MKNIISLLFCLFFISSLFSQPKIDYHNLVLKTENNPGLIKIVENEASKKNLPVCIYIPNKAFIEAKDVENGKIVYSVIINFARPDIGSYSAFYENISSAFDLTKARVHFANGIVVDNSGEVLTFRNKSVTKLLLIPDWTYDRVMAFDFFTGDLVDTAFIHSNNPNLQSPKQAIQKSKSRILVSDQISDGVYEYDTTGVFLRLFAPASGINNAILDNVRGIIFRPNGNLLVCNASGAAQNTIQQFDTAGNYMNSFMTVSVNSPFCLLYRQGDILLTNSSGTPKMFKYDFNGSLINAFTSTTLNFVQQAIKNTNGNIIACEFSGTGSGLKVFDSTGNLLNTLSGVTGVRGVFRIQNGNYLTTNSTGLFEIDDTTGVVVRQIYVSSNLQYIDLFDRNLTTSIENNDVPGMYKLYNNYPNPFNPSTKIKFEIGYTSSSSPRYENVSLKVFDILGKEVATLVNEQFQPGTYEVTFDGSNIQSGVYFYQLRAGEYSETRKFVLLK